jgi:hypothetical protein
MAAFGLICGGLPGAEAANFTCSWNDATANWTTVADWSNCNSTFPNNGNSNTYDVTISLGDPTLTTPVTLGSVTVNSPPPQMVSEWTITGTGASANLTGTLTNSGAVSLQNGALVTVGSGLNNTSTGSLLVDNSGAGGSSLNIAGTLTNSGAGGLPGVFIGNSGISQATIVTAAGLSNTGTIEIQGSATKQAALEIGSAAPSTWTGRADLFGDSLLQFGGTSQISTIGSGAQITLTGPQAYVAAAGINSASNSALRGLTSNAGTFGLANGASVMTTGGLSNVGTLAVDSGSAGGSSLNVTGTLSNSGTGFSGVLIGNSGISQPVTVTMGGLSNTGTFNITSGTATATVISPTLTNTGAININGGTAQAALEVGSPAPATWTGTADLTGNALLQFSDANQIGTIGSGAGIFLTGPLAHVAAAGINNTSNSALVGLTTIAGSGTLSLASGNSLTTSGGLTVNTGGSLQVDPGPGDAGGSSLNITGTLANAGSVLIGPGSEFGTPAPTTVTAPALVNTGTIGISGAATTRSTLDIGAPAPSTWTGSAFLSGDALLQFTGSNQISTIGNNATINLTGPQAFVAAAGLGATSNSALTGLTTINTGGDLV